MRTVACVVQEVSGWVLEHKGLVLGDSRKGGGSIGREQEADSEQPGKRSPASAMPGSGRTLPFF